MGLLPVISKTEREALDAGTVWYEGELFSGKPDFKRLIKEEKYPELTDEEITKSYHSENEDEDKWDNIEKACWSGYKQVGMKTKNGKRVPNCVPEAQDADIKDRKGKMVDGIFVKEGDL